MIPEEAQFDRPDTSGNFSANKQEVALETQMVSEEKNKALRADTIKFFSCSKGILRPNAGYL